MPIRTEGGSYRNIPYKHPQIPEEDVCIMQQLTEGKAPSEINTHRQISSVQLRIYRLRQNGVDFPNQGEWFGDYTTRKIVMLTQSGVYERSEIQEKLVLSKGALSVYIHRLRTAGINLSIANRCDVTSPSGDRIRETYVEFMQQAVKNAFPEKMSKDIIRRRTIRLQDAGVEFELPVFKK